MHPSGAGSGPRSARSLSASRSLRHDETQLSPALHTLSGTALHPERASDTSDMSVPTDRRLLRTLLHRATRLFNCLMLPLSTLTCCFFPSHIRASCERTQGDQSPEISSPPRLGSPTRPVRRHLARSRSRPRRSRSRRLDHRVRTRSRSRRSSCVCSSRSEKDCPDEPESGRVGRGQEGD